MPRKKQKKRGPKPKPVAERRVDVLKIRVNRAEAKRYDQAAKISGASTSRWARAVLDEAAADAVSANQLSNGSARVENHGKPGQPPKKIGARPEGDIDSSQAESPH